MFAYLDEKGVDVEPICAKMKMSREDLTKPGNMLSLPDGLTVIQEVKVALNEPDPRIMYFIGRESTRLGSFGTLIDIGRKMGNTEKSVRFVPRFNRKFNDIFEMSAYNVTRDAGIVLVQYKDKPGYDTVWILDQDHWNEGIIAGIPLAWGLPYMSTETVLSRFTIEALFRAYDHRGYKLEKRGHRYLVEGSEIAMDVVLETEEVERSRDMLQIVGQTDKHRILTNMGAVDIEKVPVKERDRVPRGVMFTSDFPISDLWTIKENTVFGAPYSRINLKWQARRDLRTVVGEFILGERDGDKKLLEALENELTASKEKTYEIERLYWNLKGQFARERKLERIMTGGFAHEERNALTGALYQFQDIMDFEGGKTALELIRQESAAILKSVLAMQEDSGIPKHVIEQEIIPRFRRQSDTLKAMERKLENVGEGIRRALEITERIRAYSRMQDFQRGDERVDLEELLIQYKEIYSQRISESQIT
ncbi:MAG: hypothetical protein COX16_08300 [Deltaproteobacteria bacterium CG23_combo_of_CG06-09_8_20_14_all_51_20]|nr:hypothetical protein [bacterium]OIP39302.1 MAG: hypothetical protein AUK25_10715 [Desulfobacteraceae bacterium CG2_30_51_40]PIP46713.1 MAG: hypothetical protein COX16_08300 [Deltaproteobacteria bacterium CG23_combo_of_CG06-09_8_20_14_all_51_20]